LKTASLAACSQNQWRRRRKGEAIMSLGVAAVLVAVGLWFVWRRIYLTRLKRWLETLEQAQISAGTDPSRIYRVVFSSLFLPDQFGLSAPALLPSPATRSFSPDVRVGRRWPR